MSAPLNNQSNVPGSRNAISDDTAAASGGQTGSPLARLSGTGNLDNNLDAILEDKDDSDPDHPVVVAAAAIVAAVSAASTSRERSRSQQQPPTASFAQRRQPGHQPHPPNSGMGAVVEDRIGVVTVPPADAGVSATSASHKYHRSRQKSPLTSRAQLHRPEHRPPPPNSGMDAVVEDKNDSATVPPASASRKRRRSQHQPPPPSLSLLRRRRIRDHQNISRQRRRRRRRRRPSPPNPLPVTPSSTVGPRMGRRIDNVPLSSYQAASNGTSFYHPHRVSHYYDPLLSSHSAGTARAAGHPMPLIATANLLQNELLSVRQMALLSTSVNTPQMFSDYADNFTSIEEVERERLEERRIAARVHLRVPLDAVAIGGHSVPVLDRPPRRILGLDDTDSTYFSSTYFSARRLQRSEHDTESLNVHVNSRMLDDARTLSSDSGYHSSGTNSLAGEADLHPGDTDTSSRSAESASVSSADDVQSSHSGSHHGGFDGMPFVWSFR